MFVYKIKDPSKCHQRCGTLYFRTSSFNNRMDLFLATDAPCSLATLCCYASRTSVFASGSLRSSCFSPFLLLLPLQPASPADANCIIAARVFCISSPVKRARAALTQIAYERVYRPICRCWISAEIENRRRSSSGSRLHPKMRPAYKLWRTIVMQTMFARSDLAICQLRKLCAPMFYCSIAPPFAQYFEICDGRQ